MSDTTPPREALRKLAVIETVKDSYGLVFGRLGLWLKAAAAPYMISMVLAAFALIALTNTGLLIPLVVLGFVPLILFAVAWYRLSLLGPSVSPPRVAPSWNRRHWRFCGFGVAVIAIFYGLWFGIAILSAIFVLLMGGSDMPKDQPVIPVVFFGITAVTGSVGSLYLMMRYSFVFPAVAVDENYGLRNAWTQTRGQGFRLIGLMFLTVIPIAAVFLPLIAILGHFMIQGVDMVGAMMGYFMSKDLIAFVFAHVIMNALNYLLMAVMVSAISIAFRTCTGWVPAASGEAPGSESKAR